MIPALERFADIIENASNDTRELVWEGRVTKWHRDQAMQIQDQLESYRWLYEGPSRIARFKVSRASS
jgi:hypothetical protein